MKIITKQKQQNLETPDGRDSHYRDAVNSTEKEPTTAQAQAQERRRKADQGLDKQNSRFGEQQRETRTEPRERVRTRRQPRREEDDPRPPRQNLTMDEYLYKERPQVQWETRLYTMSRVKEVGKFKAYLNTKLRNAWNDRCDNEQDMGDNERVAEHTNLVAVVNRIEENQSDAYTQLTCRKNEWHIVDSVITEVLTEAKPIPERINPFLPRRRVDDNEDDWHRRVLYRTIRVLRLWEAAADNRPVNGSLRKHFNQMVLEAKNLVVGEVAQHVKQIRVDPSGKKEAFVVEKDTAQREKEKKLAAMALPPTTAPNQGVGLNTPRILNPSSVLREFEGTQHDTIMKEDAPE